jgi:hypothetical protein
MPRAAQGDPNNNLRTSDRFLEDGSFGRLKNLSIGYTIQPGLLKKVRLRSLRLYGTAQNLFTLTPYSGYDPEVNTLADATLSAGTDYLVMPQPRTFLLGIQLGL